MVSEKKKWYFNPYLLLLVGVVLTQCVTDLSNNKVPFKSQYEFIDSNLKNFQPFIGLDFIKGLYITIGLICCLFIWNFINRSRNTRTNNILNPVIHPPQPLKVNYSHINNNEANKLKIALERKLKYIADEFEGLIWKWDWIHNDLIGKFKVKNITPCCSSVGCDNLGLIPSTLIDNKFFCPNCNKEYNIQLNESEVLKKIEAQANYLESPGFESNERRARSPQTSDYFMKRPSKN